jgi:hypothetical protein
VKIAGSHGERLEAKRTESLNASSQPIAVRRGREEAGSPTEGAEHGSRGSGVAAAARGGIEDEAAAEAGATTNGGHEGCRMKLI